MNENIKLYQGDCLEVMKSFPDELIDLTVTSPPYDNLRTYEGTLDDWSFEKFQEIAKELFRITKIGGVVVWVVGDATIKGSETGTSFKQALYFKEIGFNLHDTMIYAKKKYSPYDPKNKRYKQQFEYMFIFSKYFANVYNPINDVNNKNAGKIFFGRHGRKIDGSIRNASVKMKTIKEYQDRSNIWEYSSETRNEHPATFPEQLANDHIISWSNEEDIVFDPFLGSGTTGKMAVLNNRKFIGIERVEKYFKIAEERINKAIQEKNENLFSENKG